MFLTPRKRLFVDKKVQGALLYRIAIYWCFSVLAVLSFLLVARVIIWADGPILDNFAYDEFLAKYWPVIAASALLVPLIMWDVLVISNRFAGPLLRLRRNLRALAAGEHVEPIQFREKDFWRDFAEEFNAVAAYIEQLKQQLAEAKRSGRDSHDFEPAGHK